MKASDLKQEQIDLLWELDREWLLDHRPGWLMEYILEGRADTEVPGRKMFAVNLDKETIETLMRLSKHYGQTPDNFLTSLIRASDQWEMEGEKDGKI